MNTRTLLELHALSPEDHLACPEEFRDLTMDSPAREIFTDFREHRPFVIDHNTPASEALRLMREMHVKLVLVVDQHEHFIGVASHDDLSLEKRLAAQGADAAHAEPVVEDLMRPASRLQAIAFHDLLHSTIGRVVATLERFGKQHCLVVDSPSHQIRGLISASDIARRLHMSVTIESAPTFVDIFQALKTEAA